MSKRLTDWHKMCTSWFICRYKFGKSCYHLKRYKIHPTLIGKAITRGPGCLSAGFCCPDVYCEWHFQDPWSSFFHFFKIFKHNFGLKLAEVQYGRNWFGGNFPVWLFLLSPDNLFLETSCLLCTLKLTLCCRIFFALFKALHTTTNSKNVQISLDFY